MVSTWLIVAIPAHDCVVGRAAKTCKDTLVVSEQWALSYFWLGQEGGPALVWGWVTLPNRLVLACPLYCASGLAYTPHPPGLGGLALGASAVL